MTPEDIDLTRGWLVHGSQALAIATIVAAVAFWPGRKGWRRHWTLALTLLARLATLVGVLVLTVAAVALTLNVHFGLATTWSDVAGLFQGTVDPGSADPDDTHAGATVPGSSVEETALASFQVNGLLSHRTGRVDVWTPPGYNAKHNHGAYPVLVALHGWPGNPTYIEQHMQLSQAVAQVAGRRHMAWPIIVMPQWGTGRTDTECTDGASDKRIETWLAKDVPAWVKLHYRVRNGPQNWATYGYSAGAYCSRMMVMKHSSVFGADIDLSGYSYPVFETNYVPFQRSSPQGQAYDMVHLAHTAAPKAAFYLVSDPADTNPSEGDSYPSTLAFKNAAHPPMQITWVLGRGGHTTTLWRPQTLLGLEWLGHTLSGFRA